MLEYFKHNFKAKKGNLPIHIDKVLIGIKECTELSVRVVTIVLMQKLGIVMPHILSKG